ncbi:lipase class 3 family protein [Schizopora paradoxa]|uniref:Lipase class 3 family protein n=1 Tax=Schizopora paradoxa TaxID=27342 RepID=A0A0H2R7E4_9AGAM|nr:lipase class 3 family protein [Schizopora paradoxa]
MAFLQTLALLSTLVSFAAALPPLPRALESRQTQSIKTVASSQISTFKPYTFYASAAYCQPNTTLSWSCGANCDANSGFQPSVSGGDGTDTQFWYVGYDPSLNTVVAAHQGTDPSSILSLINDIDIIQTSLNSSLFPADQFPDTIQVHQGFADDHARTAIPIYAAVVDAIVANLDKQPSVTLVGHSLGAALALLDAVMFVSHLPDWVQIKYVGYGLPRVGNQEFADYVDAHLTTSDNGLVRITNKKDPIPINPGKFLGFVHPSGELHIEETNAWDSCPGQDNPSTLCIVGAVSNDFEGDLDNHDGPYDGVTMGCD